MKTIENYQFSKQYRLNQTADFKALFNTGKKHNNHQRYFALFTKSNHLSLARLGVVVAKKAIPTAVKRNQYKRVIRESFRLNQLKLIGLDIIVVVYHHAGKLTKKQIREALDQEWLRLISYYKKS